MSHFQKNTEINQKRRVFRKVEIKALLLIKSLLLINCFGFVQFVLFFLWVILAELAYLFVFIIVYYIFLVPTYSHNIFIFLAPYICCNN